MGDTAGLAQRVLLGSVMVVLACWPWLAGAADEPLSGDAWQQGDGRGLDWPDYFQSGRAERLVDDARRAVQDLQFDAAEQLLNQALQVNRASAGLYNPAQFDVVDDLLQTLLLQQKWGAMDQRLDYVRWLNNRLYADDPERLAEGLLRQSRWHRAAAAAINDTASAWYLVQGKYLDWQAVSALESRFGKTDRRLVPILYQIVLSHFYQTVSIERRGMTSFEFKTDQKVIANGWMSSRSETVQRSYRIGKELLQRIRSIHGAQPDFSAPMDALLQIQQADWELLYGATPTALELYQQAFRQLIQAGIAVDEVDAFFSRPQVLPLGSVQTEWNTAAGADTPPVLRVDAWSAVYPGVEVPAELRQLPFSLQRQNSGRVRAQLTAAGEPGVTGNHFEVRLLDLESGCEPLRQRALAEIPLLTLRPRFKGGELAAHEPILLDYRFPPE